MDTGSEHGAGDDTKSLTEGATDGLGDDTKSIRSIVEEGYREQLDANTGD